MPKAAATPAATIPAPAYSPPTANMVAAAPLEEVEVAEAATLAPEAEDEVAVAAAEELLLLEATATKSSGLL